MHILPRTSLATLTLVALCVWPPLVRADGPTDEFERTRQEIEKHVSEGELSQDEVTEWIEFAENVKSTVKRNLTPWDRLVRAVRDPWVFFGLAAQATFMMRFVLQIVASERKKKSYVPIGFWYLSIIGGSMLFVYALQLRDPVFVLGQGLGIFIYTRNLMLIYRRRGAFQDSKALRQQRNNHSGESPPQDEPNGS